MAALAVLVLVTAASCASITVAAPSSDPATAGSSVSSSPSAAPRSSSAPSASPSTDRRARVTAAHPGERDGDRGHRDRVADRAGVRRAGLRARADAADLRPPTQGQAPEDPAQDRQEGAGGRPLGRRHAARRIDLDRHGGQCRVRAGPPGDRRHGLRDRERHEDVRRRAHPPARRRGQALPRRPVRALAPRRAALEDRDDPRAAQPSERHPRLLRLGSLPRGDLRGRPRSRLDVRRHPRARQDRLLQAERLLPLLEHELRHPRPDRGGRRGQAAQRPASQAPLRAARARSHPPPARGPDPAGRRARLLVGGRPLHRPHGRLAGRPVHGRRERRQRRGCDRVDRRTTSSSGRTPSMAATSSRAGPATRC